MRGVRRRTAAILAVAGAGACGAAPAAAGQEIPRLLMSAGIDMWRHGAFGHGSLVYAPDGLARDSTAFKLLLAGGTYGYVHGTTGIDALQFSVSLLPGWRRHLPGASLSVHAGPEVQRLTRSPHDPAGRASGTRIGLRAGFDLWLEPAPGVMASLAVSATTTGPGYWARINAGLRIADAAWLGPEATVCGDDASRQTRFGVHVTGVTFGAAEWSAGAGITADTDARSGLYARLGVSTRR